MDRIALLTLPLFATVELVPTKAADLVTQTDVAAVMTAVPSEGAAHHALAKRQADELSLTDADRPRQIMGQYNRNHFEKHSLINKLQLSARGT